MLSWRIGIGGKMKAKKIASKRSRSKKRKVEQGKSLGVLGDYYTGPKRIKGR